MVKLLFGVGVLLLYQLASLLFSNVTKAKDYGIQEADVVSLVATHLTLVLITIVVVTGLYFTAFRHHQEKAGLGTIGSGTAQKEDYRHPKTNDFGHNARQLLFSRC